jgi:hypothetical protein
VAGATASSIVVLLVVPSVSVAPALVLRRRFVFDHHDVGLPMLCLEAILPAAIVHGTGTKQPKAPTRSATPATVGRTFDIVDDLLSVAKVSAVSGVA